MTHRTRRLLTAGAIATALAILAGCAAPAQNPEAGPTEEPVTQASTVTVDDAWVKTADGGMTAAFGIITNMGESEVNVVGVTTDAASVAELHETVEDDSGTMVMRPIEGGFVIPAGSDFPLEPAANHLMLMELAGPLATGEAVDFTLEFADGSTLEFTGVVKDYSGANENYVGDGDMDMDGDD